MDQNTVQTFVQDPTKYTRPPVCKEVFAAIYRLLEDSKVSSVLDIGCASGDFLHFLPEHITATGIDKSEQLVKIAKSRNQKTNVEFKELDILVGNVPGSLCDSYDAVTIIGTLHTFHDFRPLLNSALRLNPKTLIIHSPFNSQPVDAMHFQRDLTHNETDFQCAYNIFSKKTMEQYLQEKGISQYCFIPFEMKTTLKRDEKYPLHNYHVTLDDGKRYLTNGIGIIFEEYILVVNRNAE